VKVIRNEFSQNGFINYQNFMNILRVYFT